MVLTLLAWGIMTFLFVAAGACILQVCRIDLENISQNVDLALVVGICAVTTYAQYASLLGKVSSFALVVLTGITIVLIFVYKSIFSRLCGDLFKELVRKSRGSSLVIAGILFFTAMTASRQPEMYDTYLYHAQSVRWIEEYGVVKGLGVLHNRLAYNSSIFSLEALFSFKPVLDRTMHAVEGDFPAFLLLYAFVSFKFFRTKRFYLSDFLRLSIPLYFLLGDVVPAISSLGSDIPACCLFLYGLIKCVSVEEEEMEKLQKQKLRIVCCILYLFVGTVKLSAVCLVSLVCVPIVYSFKSSRKQMLWQLSAVIALAVIIYAPFLIRNVLISGYLIYPYSGIDIFAVDWKMPAFTLDFDRYEIGAWGKGLKDVFRFDEPFAKWFPLWYEQLPVSLKVFFVADLCCIPGLIAAWFHKVRKSKRREDMALVAVLFTVAASLTLWFFGAPLPRYGACFLLLLPLLLAGILCENLRSDVICDRMERLKSTRLGTILAKSVLLLAAASCFLMGGVVFYLKMEVRDIIVPADYAEKTGYVKEVDGELVWIPADGEQAGYNLFPSTPYDKRLQLIELRGEDIKDGFRMKQEYRNAFVSTYGDIFENNISVIGILPLNSTIKDTQTLFGYAFNW